MRRVSFLALTLLLAGQSLPAIAHPHVYIETGLVLELNDAAEVTGVRVTWLYDEFYSLLVMQDMGLDEDADGALTPDELAQVDGWDMKWVEGYAGDLYLTAADGAAVRLGPPVPVSTEVREGRLQSVHVRPLDVPVPARGLALKAYDPEFYTAYDLNLGVTITAPAGAPACLFNIDQPDRDEAFRAAQAVMAEFPEDAEEVPLLGHLFADTVIIQCPVGN